MNTRQRRVRLTQLAELFEAAGFTRVRNDEWERATEDVRWGAMLSVVRKEETFFDVTFSADYLPAPDFFPLVGQGLGDLPAASQTIYLAHDELPEDPLIADARDVLLPLINRMGGAAKIVDGWLDGVWGGWTRVDPIARAWRLATEHGFHAKVERAERMVRDGKWSPSDRAEFREAGLPIRGVTLPSGAPDWVERAVSGWRTRGRLE